MTRRARAQPITTIQKCCMGIMGVIALGSFGMVCLQEIGVVESDSAIFSHLLFSTLSAMGGYLFGSNMKIPVSGGGT